MSLLQYIPLNSDDKLEKILKKCEIKEFPLIKDDDDEVYDIVDVCITLDSPVCLKYILDNCWNYDELELKQKVPSIINVCSYQSGLDDDGSLRFLKIFVRNAKEANVWNDMNETPIHKVIEQSNEKSLKYLLGMKADVETRDIEDMTPLIRSAYSENESACVKILIEHGADINAVDFDNGSALYYSVQNDKYPDAKALMDAKADVNIRYDGTCSAYEFVQKNAADYKDGTYDNRISNLFNKIYRQRRKRKMTECVEDTCPICLDVLGSKNVKITKCLHAFHKNCWKKYDNKDRCPICRGVAT